MRFLVQNRSCSLQSAIEAHRTWHHLHRCTTSLYLFGNRIRDTSPCRFCSLSSHSTCARVLIFVCRILSPITCEKRRKKGVGVAHLCVPVHEGSVSAPVTNETSPFFIASENFDNSLFMTSGNSENKSLWNQSSKRRSGNECYEQSGS